MATQEQIDEAYDAWMAAREHLYKTENKLAKAQNKVYEAEVAASRAYQRFKELGDEHRVDRGL